MEMRGYSNNDWNKHDHLKKQLAALESSQEANSLASRQLMNKIEQKLDSLCKVPCKDPRNAQSLIIHTDYKQKYEKRLNLLKQSIRLSNVMICPTVHKIIPYLELLESLPKLTTICVFGCHLNDLINYYSNGVGLPIFSNIPSLEVFVLLEPEIFSSLSLSSNLTGLHFSGSLAGSEESIAHSISNCKTLQTFYYDTLDDDDDDVAVLEGDTSVWIPELAKKTDLIKCTTFIGENYASDVVMLIENNQGLKKLSLLSATAESLEIICSSLENSNSIERLEITFKESQMIEDSFDSLKSILTINKCLKHLQITFFESQDLEDIWNKIVSLTDLNTTLCHFKLIAPLFDTPTIGTSVNPLLIVNSPLQNSPNCRIPANISQMKEFHESAQQLLIQSRKILLLLQIIPSFYIYGMIDCYLSNFSIDVRLLRSVLLNRNSIGFMTKYSTGFNYQELIRNCSKYQKLENH
ncbi:hypothetical protein HDV02_002201 [Globomyces sp. JEL0801]|nr:hypothetical protein HDV02_002201 [Globomyces sp. JEL0801]